MTTIDTYRTPVAMSDAGHQARLFDGLPHDVGGLAQVVQGLLVHEHIAPASLMPSWRIWPFLSSL